MGHIYFFTLRWRLQNIHAPRQMTSTTVTSVTTKGMICTQNVLLTYGCGHESHDSLDAHMNSMGPSWCGPFFAKPDS